MMRKLFILCCFLLIALSVQSQNEPRTLSRTLLHNTVRIEVIKPNESGCGTGFLFYFTSTAGHRIPVVVTCWHVVQDAGAGHFFISLSTNTVSDYQDRIECGVSENFEKFWIRHPDTNVDLAIMPIASFLKQAQNANLALNFSLLSSNDIPTRRELQIYGVFQEVKFVGYPIGIWDQSNNLPVIRRGMTATDPVVDYNGQTKFLIDAAVVPGSSGSPVLIADEGAYMQGGSVFAGGGRLKLLGIISDCWFLNSDGKVEIKQIPSSFDVNVQTRVPINLGVVIKAERLNDFLPILENRPQTTPEGLRSSQRDAPTSEVTVTLKSA
jgi:hypothetical protein